MSTESEIKKLLQYTIGLYQDRKMKKKISDRIYRGRINSISNEFENKFALFLERELPKKYTFLVDCKISYYNVDDEKPKEYYPDIAIIKNNSKLVGIIELKTDPGFLEEKWIINKNLKYNQLKESAFSKYDTKLNNEKTKQHNLDVNRYLKRAIVFLTDSNHREKLECIPDKTNLFILSTNIHPNKIKEDKIELKTKEIFSKPENKENWKRLDKFLKKNFK